MKKKRCACCGEYGIDNPLFACPVCGWFVDPEQEKDSKLKTGRNIRSLDENRYAYYLHKKDRRYF